MMKAEFIPYKQALELKELGFNEKCLGYHNLDPYLPNPTFNLVIPFEHEWCLPAPLYQQAFRFFRDNYGLFCWVYPTVNLGNKETARWTFDTTDFTKTSFRFYTFDTYEEAELACLKKLIEIVKNKQS